MGEEVLPLLVRDDVHRRHRLELVQTRWTRNDLNPRRGFKSSAIGYWILAIGKIDKEEL